MKCPGREALDACAARELAPERAAAVEAHAAGCDACGRRLAWLRREDRAIRSWAARDQTGDVEHLWAGIQSRIERKPARRWATRAAIAATAVAAAAVLLLARAPREDDEQTPSAAAAMTHAEEDYTRAFAALEAQVAARHPPAGRHEIALSRARNGLATARASAGSGPAARVRLLEGYAAYLKSLRRALQDDQP